MRFILISIFSLFLASCVSPRRIVVDPNRNHQPPIGTTTGGASTVSSGGSQTSASGAPTGTPLEVLNRADSHLTRQGFRRTGPAVRNANMPAGGIVAYAINATPGQCYIAVAIGAQGTDLNLIVLDPQGRPVGHNVAQDSYPWVRLCATINGRFIARLQMASGQGEYYYALYQGGQADPGLAAVLGGTSSAATQVAMQQVDIDSQTQSRLNALDQRLSAQRFRRVGPPQGVRRDSSEDYIRTLNLQQGTCYTFASLGGMGAQDTDIYILNSEGDSMAQERENALDAVVEYCPPTTGTYRLRANMYSGSGPIFVAGWSRQVSQAQANPTPATEPVMGGAEVSQGIDEQHALLHANMQARGYESYGETHRGELQQGQTREFDIQVEGGKCYAILGVGANSVRNLDLILHGPDGSAIDRDMADDARPIVRVCTQNSGAYRMQVKMSEGSGAFVYHAYRWPRGTRGPFGLNGLIYVRLAEVSSLLNVEGYEPNTNLSPGRGRLRREGASARHSLQLPANQCVAVLVVGGEGMNDIDLSLTKGSTRLSADGTRNPFPTVRFCTEQAGRYQLNINSASGAGQYFYQVFQRDEDG